MAPVPIDRSGRRRGAALALLVLVAAVLAWLAWTWAPSPPDAVKLQSPQRSSPASDALTGAFPPLPPSSAAEQDAVQTRQIRQALGVPAATPALQTGNCADLIAAEAQASAECGPDPRDRHCVRDKLLARQMDPTPLPLCQLRGRPQ